MHPHKYLPCTDGLNNEPCGICTFPQQYCVENFHPKNYKGLEDLTYCIMCVSYYEEKDFSVQRQICNDCVNRLDQEANGKEEND